MISRKDLEEKYAAYSNEELVEVIRNAEGYTEIAIAVAREELGPLFHFAIKQNLREHGYVFIAKQAGYYSLMGFLFFILTGCSLAVLPEKGALLVWPLGLFVAHYLEKFLVKRDF